MPQLVPTQDKVKTVRALLDKSRPQIATALPRHMTVDRMVRIAMTSLQRTPKLLDCDPLSFVGAVIQSAQLGLEPDGVLGHAYLVPYYNSRRNVHEVQFQPGYKGLLALARRSGDIASVDTRVVYAKDRFDYAFGLSPRLEHVPAPDDDPGPVTHAYAVVRLKDGAVQFDVMTRAAVEAHRRHYSRASDDGPWVTAWDEMAKKTVLRRALKLAPASIELSTAVALDEHAEAGVPQGLDVLASVTATTTTAASDGGNLETAGGSAPALDAFIRQTEVERGPNPDAPPADVDDVDDDVADEAADDVDPGPVPEPVDDATDDDAAERAAIVTRLAGKLSGMKTRDVLAHLKTVGLATVDDFDRVDVAVLHDLARRLGA